MEAKQLVAGLMVLVVFGPMALAVEVIDPGNSNWLIYRDTYSADESTAGYYDGYQEVKQGDTFTVHIILNRDAPWGSNGVRYMNAYRNRTWWDPGVIDNSATGDPSVQPTANYAYSELGFTQWGPEYQSHNYVQLFNQNAYGSVDNMDISSTGSTYEDPFVLLSWDIPIREDAPLGLTTMPLLFDAWYTWANPNPMDSFQTDDALTINVVAAEPPPPGDFDGDYDVDAYDIDILCDNMGGDPATYDLNNDSLVDEGDLVYLVQTILGTYMGDFNLDGVVNATDLGTMSTNFGLSGFGWAGGNANCDDVINATDLGLLSSNFGLGGGGSSVPEPATLALLALGGLAMLRRRKSQIPKGS